MNVFIVIGDTCKLLFIMIMIMHTILQQCATGEEDVLVGDELSGEDMLNNANNLFAEME